MGVIDSIRFNKFKNKEYIFEFKANPIETKDLDIINRVNVKGTKYYIGSLVSAKAEGIRDSQNIHLYIRRRYLNSVTESIYNLSKITDGIKYIYNNKVFIDFNIFLANSLDFIMCDSKKEKDYSNIRNILHFFTKDRNGLTIEGYLIYDENAVTKDFSDYILNISTHKPQ